MHEFDALRKRLQRKKGRAFWRSLEELAESEAFQDFLKHEFPRQFFPWEASLDRRRFLKLAGASLALAGLTACTPQSARKVVPYVKQPPEILTGEARFYATVFTHGGFAEGLLAKSLEGRPIKLEGNPEHPTSLGATSAFAQASLLTLYDPERSQEVRHRGRPSTWEDFEAYLARVLAAQEAQGGRGLRILTETVTSPTLAATLRQVLERFPEARWYAYEPVNHDNLYAGARLAFGEEVWPVYRVREARVIVSLDADLLYAFPGSVRYAREFADGRRVRAGTHEMNRLYVVESGLTLTGAAADHRLALRPSQVQAFALELARALGVVEGGPFLLEHAGWAEKVALDLAEHRGQGLVIAGPHQPPLVHALAHAINAAMGNAGRTVVYLEPIEANPRPQQAGLEALAREMAEGQVEALFILGGNPAYTAPADLGFAEHLKRVPFSVHLGVYQDETAALCRWHLPEAHYLEAWGDARAHDGTVSIIQPLIEPLYGGRSALELAAALAGEAREGYDLVRAYWQAAFTEGGGGNFEAFWRQALHDGVVPGTAGRPRPVALRSDWAPRAWPQPEVGEGLEVLFQPDPTVWDGRYAANAWLQELPKPITKLTWDNAVLISPKTAERVGVAEAVRRAWARDDTRMPLVRLTLSGRHLEAPVFVVPGLPDDTVTVHLGYGRTRAGVGSNAGFNAYALRTSASPWFASGAELVPAKGTYTLATTQNHHSMEGRDLIRAEPLEAFVAGRVGEESPIPEASLYPEFEYEGYAWAMTIDLTTCIGCNACVAACQAENNIPVVGKPEVLRGREMHWIRIDRYFEGALETPRVYHQPVPCMHCERAPCEPVCPVGATLHDSEGLNVMVYNRCIGTRYCSNNCPYKVRRFNFFDYANRFLAPEGEVTPLTLLMNPEVTVRSRGVMEKCTYCTQRINAARIAAKKEGRRIQDGEVVPACQAACPTQAIVFGDLNDPQSRVRALKEQPHHYTFLSELNTQPRTTYLARIQNPNPALGMGEEVEG
ncbi:TAT-variant-translocated molybdopterin oxidoreductase [Marinithermus hydrothermalis]|uniref:Molybdopterin oxidoreductase, iron-sulfur binding subunit n=1 Tax=Marinithermus hydrothermalis (strain DSM 14884 / JCM 11576 / T1) TaxID=869210 RepID=F2NR61_MARHT|nr:TAT-variant-translocated molybdopterin oxidoreductase [Marinithermus hydrothermalis]AEB12910.1 molybdopterin oxidoreductase, iron-sulfur binding subunit [Marinithermus hydrothermalis DSM 14884]